MKTCAQRQCDEALKGCNQYPAGDLCRDAVGFCNKPIKTTKAICTATFMGRVVKYDDKAGTCSLDESGAKAPWRATFDLGRTPVDLHLFITCSLLTEAGAQAVASTFLDLIKKSAGSDCPKTNRPVPAFDVLEYCYADRSVWDPAMKVVAAACAKAEPAGNDKPIFASHKY